VEESSVRAYTPSVDASSDAALTAVFVLTGVILGRVALNAVDGRQHDFQQPVALLPLPRLPLNELRISKHIRRLPYP
jgi:hypothetical protein